MKLRKIMISTLIIALLSGTAVYAADAVVQKLRVWVNKKEVDDGGILVDGKSYLSLKQLNEKLDGIFLVDDSTKRVSIYKPNVHMVTRRDDKMFSDVPKGVKVKFNVFSMIDSLKVDISAFKVTIDDPYGESTWIDGRDNGDKDFPDVGKENFNFLTDDLAYSFDSTGRYIIRFWMKPAGESSYQVVSEKVINSK
ncbi:copper amine oxidase [Cohnella yongneupensis]|uniref:Copper amine oxidase n=1 Tax=Cohnella yongneupensis TaxID=425006 RepID=A0ABW0R4Z4_9BACL